MTNNLVVFGGSKDVAFNQEISDLLGQVRVSRVGWQAGPASGRHVSADDIPILTGTEVRQLRERHALVLSENGAPIIARLHRCIEGRSGRRLLADQALLRRRVGATRQRVIPAETRAVAAVVEARRRGLTRESGDMSS